MKIKRKLLLGSISFVIPLMFPIFLTSCAEEVKKEPVIEDSKNIDLMDLTNYTVGEHDGHKAYGFIGDLVNDELKNKTKKQLSEYLGIKETSSRISKSNFEKIIKGVTFTSLDKDSKPTTVTFNYSLINTIVIDNNNLSFNTLISDWDGTKNTIDITISLLNGATWSNGSKDNIWFKLVEK